MLTNVQIWNLGVFALCWAFYELRRGERLSQASGFDFYRRASWLRAGAGPAAALFAGLTLSQQPWANPGALLAGGLALGCLIAAHHVRRTAMDDLSSDQRQAWEDWLRRAQAAPFADRLLLRFPK